MHYRKNMFCDDRGAMRCGRAVKCLCWSFGSVAGICDESLMQGKLLMPRSRACDEIPIVWWNASVWWNAGRRWNVIVGEFIRSDREWLKLDFRIGFGRFFFPQPNQSIVVVVPGFAWTPFQRLATSFYIILWDSHSSIRQLSAMRWTFRHGWNIPSSSINHGSSTLRSFSCCRTAIKAHFRPVHQSSIIKRVDVKANEVQILIVGLAAQSIRFW